MTRYTIEPEGDEFRVYFNHDTPAGPPMRQKHGLFPTLEAARKSLKSLVRCPDDERLCGGGAIEEYRLKARQTFQHKERIVSDLQRAAELSAAILKAIRKEQIGIGVAYDGKLLSECPYSTPDLKQAWERGWALGRQDREEDIDSGRHKTLIGRKRK